MFATTESLVRKREVFNSNKRFVVRFGTLAEHLPTEQRRHNPVCCDKTVSGAHTEIIPKEAVQNSIEEVKISLSP